MEMIENAKTFIKEHDTEIKYGVGGAALTAAGIAAYKVFKSGDKESCEAAASAACDLIDMF